MIKKLVPLFAVALLLAACQSKEAKTTDLVATDTTKYPYTPKKVHSWQMNPEPQNMVAAMSALKGFAALDTAAVKPFLGDSIWLMVDNYSFKGTRSQFLGEAQHEIDRFKHIQVDMEDMESVISKDKSEEWVSLWYKQISTMKDGKTDTVNCFNDFKMKDGKVVGWSEYVQHPMKRKP